MKIHGPGSLIIAAIILIGLLLEGCGPNQSIVTRGPTRRAPVQTAPRPTATIERLVPPPLPPGAIRTGDFFEISISGDKTAALHFEAPFSPAAIECNANGFDFHALADRIGEGWDILLNAYYYGNTGRHGRNRYDLSQDSGQLLISEGCPGCTYDFGFVFQTVTGSIVFDEDRAGGVFTAVLVDLGNQQIKASGSWRCQSTGP